MNQWNQTKVLDIIPQTYRLLIFDKTGKKATQNTHTQRHTLKKRRHLQIMVLVKCTAAYKRIKVDPYLNFKWIKNINIRLHTLNLIKKKVGDMLKFIGFGKGFSQQDNNSTVIKTNN